MIAMYVCSYVCSSYTWLYSPQACNNNNNNKAIMLYLYKSIEIVVKDIVFKFNSTIFIIISIKSNYFAILLNYYTIKENTSLLVTSSSLPVTSAYFLDHQVITV